MNKKFLFSLSPTLLFAPLVVTLLLVVARADKKPPMTPVDKKPSEKASSEKKFDPQAVQFFETQIRPILIARCIECHSGDEPESGLSLESRLALLTGGDSGPAIVPGDPGKSLLIRAINHGEALKMPEKEKLPVDQIAAFTKWIKMGAPWPHEKIVPLPKRKSQLDPLKIEITKEEQAYWAFQSPQEPALPRVKNSRWIQTRLDRFVLAKLEAAGLKPAPQADKRTLIRRVTFDLIGLPPTPEEINAFLADRSPDAYTKLIERLLASPDYGQRWGRHWLDVARFADSNGMDENLAYVNAFRYRDYVIDSFNGDKPFDLFVQEQLAGDLLPHRKDEKREQQRLIATSFLSIGPKMLAEDDPVKMQMDIIDEQISTVGSAFMGLTMACARCHDHKFDPLFMADYYALAGIFKSTKTMENFKVVAKWYERPIETDTSRRLLKEHQQKIADTKNRLQKNSRIANEQLRARYRRDSIKYLLAATELIKHPPAEATADGKTSLGGTLTAAQISGHGVLVEAEEYQRGNLVRDKTQYGRGIGVVYNAGPMPNFAEFDIEIPLSGTYQVEVRYAAATPRPFQIMINGKTVKTGVARNATGGWTPEYQKWSLEGLFEFRQGKNIFRIERPSGPICHVDKILVYAAGSARPKDGKPAGRTLHQLATHYKIDAAKLGRWRDVLAKIKNGKTVHPLLATWWFYAELDEAQFSAASIKLSQTLVTDEKRGKNIPAVLKKSLQQEPPESLDKLAERLQKLFLLADKQWQKLRQKNPKAARLADDDLEQIRAALFDSKGPFSSLPANPAALYTSEQSARIKNLKAELVALKKSKPQSDLSMGVTEGKIENIKIHLRGSHLTLGAEAPRVFPRVIAGTKQTPLGDNESGRLQLARWLTRADHPLTSRVIVNRVWRWHFGVGLVRTVNNFGALGERPTHPLMLDWLSRQFVQEGWSIKTLHRQMMLSATYQMSTRYDAAFAKADPENRLYWRRNRRRLEAEEIRDAIYSFGSGLDNTMGGTLLIIKPRAYVTSTASRNYENYNTPRRSVYLPIIRSALYDVFQAFDFSDPSMLSGNRAETTIAPQALFMMNSSLVHEQSLQMARDLLSKSDWNDAQRISLAYQKVFGRMPTPQEIDRSLAALVQLAQTPSEKTLTDVEIRLSAWQSLCRVLIGSNEFIFIE